PCRGRRSPPAASAGPGVAHALLVVVLRLVGLVVLDEHLVALEDLAVLAPAALEHNRDAGREHLGRRAGVRHLGGHAVVGDLEGDPVAVVDRLADDRALQAEAPVAQLLPLGHGLVDVAEVEGGVAQALVDEHPEAAEHGDQHDERGPTPPGAGPAGPGRGLALPGGAVVVVEGARRRLHRRSSAGTWRESRRPRRRTCRAYPPISAAVPSQPAAM